MLAERCALLSAEILKSQGKYSETATLLIKMTSEVRNFTFSQLLHVLQWHHLVADFVSKGCRSVFRSSASEDFMSLL